VNGEDRHLSFVIRHLSFVILAFIEKQAKSFVRVWGLFTKLSTVLFSFYPDCQNFWSTELNEIKKTIAW